MLTKIILSALLLSGIVNAAVDPLPSWNDGKNKQAIIAFVEKTTREGSADFVPPAERIAVFDNDGTLWSEQPMYVQLAFAIDRVKALAAKHPEWKTKQPFKAVLEGDKETLLAGGEKALVELIMATHAGNSVEEFQQIVLDWLSTARHAKTNRLYTEMTYQPMKEVLDYLKVNGYKNFIVSGGGIEFMRPWTEKVYGIPPEQVIGSSVRTTFTMQNGQPVLIRLAELNFNNDKEGKPVGINQHIGRRPIAAFGNSDGDLQMLQWSSAGSGVRLGAIVHHTDGAREAAYDRKSHIGKLDKALDLAPQSGWILIDMKKDWNRVFSFE